MDEILYSLKDHIIGLNFGIWDYSASIVSRCRHDQTFSFPDRTKYVNVKSDFLRSLMRALIATCHKRGAIATTGMAPHALSTSTAIDAVTMKAAVEAVSQAKLLEAEEGSDGALVYDPTLARHVQSAFDRIFRQRGPPGSTNQVQWMRRNPGNELSKFLSLPSGDVTLSGLQMNIDVSIRFILSWLEQQGTFIRNGAVEDSATAEISRSQIWLWMKTKAKLEGGSGELVTASLVRAESQKIVEHLKQESHFGRYGLIDEALALFIDIVTRASLVDFITTFLYEQAAVRAHWH